VGDLNVPLPEDLLEELDTFAKLSGLSKSKIVEVALLKYLRGYETLRALDLIDLQRV
jgi:metal-responsive CopG/Arc/MetJ family transcriptional regulator